MKIALIDSGLGGISILTQCLELLPEHDYLYIADQAYCPYGEKSAEQICQRVRGFLQFFVQEQVDIVVFACNSATIAAIEPLRLEFPALPIVGVEPAIKPAIRLSTCGRIGVLATKASLAGEKYRRLLEHYGKEAQVFAQSPENFVHYVESAQLDGPQLELEVQQVLQPLLQAGVDVIVLGCTHYPFLLPVLERHARTWAQQHSKQAVVFVDSSMAVAKRVEYLLTKQAERSESVEDVGAEKRQQQREEQPQSARAAAAPVTASAASAASAVLYTTASTQGLPELLQRLDPRLRRFRLARFTQSEPFGHL